MRKLDDLVLKLLVRIANAKDFCILCSQSQEEEGRCSNPGCIVARVWEEISR